MSATTAPPARRAIRLGVSSVVMLTVTALAGLIAFGWPLLLPSTSGSTSTLTPFLFAASLPVVIVLSLAEMSSNHLDAKALALLGVLTAIGAILRPFGTGTAGMELVFFLVILGGRVFGPGFGFVQSILTLLTSSLLTAGMGPWVPYQMIAAGYVGLVAGLLPRRPRGRGEIAMLCAYGAISAFVYGAMVDFAFWPFAAGMYGDLSWDPQAGPLHNLHVFVLYELATGTAWNLGRAATNVVAIALLGPGILHVLRRANKRAFFVDDER